MNPDDDPSGAWLLTAEGTGYIDAETLAYADEADAWERWHEACSNNNWYDEPRFYTLGDLLRSRSVTLCPKLEARYPTPMTAKDGVWMVFHEQPDTEQGTTHTIYNNPVLAEVAARQLAESNDEGQSRVWIEEVRWGETK